MSSCPYGPIIGGGFATGFRAEIGGGSRLPTIRAVLNLTRVPESAS